MSLTPVALVILAFIFILFYIVRGKSRLYVLCAGSLLYTIYLSPKTAIAVILTSLLTYFAGRRLAVLQTKRDPRSAGRFLALCLAAFVLILLGMKFLPLVPEGTRLMRRVFLPVGFSFYSFQAMSYLMDVRRGAAEERSFLRLFLYLAYFPKFVSGPIERRENFVLQLKAAETVHLMDSDRLSQSVLYIVLGLFMKMAVADRLGIYVDPMFADPGAFGGLWVFLGIFLYTLQIYADFAGYSMTAIGISLLFGVRLSPNFRQPYLASGISDFWRRWHMTLSGWLRDYLYIPLGGSRKGRAARYRNVLIVFLVCGLWHGSGMQFIVWGLLHGLYSVAGAVLDEMGFRSPARIPGADAERVKGATAGLAGNERAQGPKGSRLAGTIRRITTFLAAALAWVFFRAESLTGALTYLKGALSGDFGLARFMADISTAGWYKRDLVVNLALVLILVVMDLIAERVRESLPDHLAKRSYALRCAVITVFLLLILVFGVYGPGSFGSRPIYMEF